MKQTKVLIVIILIVFVVIFGCTTTDKAPATKIITQDEALKIIQTDRDYNSFKESYPNFEPMLLLQEKLPVNNFSDLNVLWQKEDRLSYFLPFLTDKDFLGDDYLLVFKDGKNNNNELIAIVDMNTNKSIFLATIISLEVGGIE